jgi:hypothetical protein
VSVFNKSSLRVINVVRKQRLQSISKEFNNNFINNIIFMLVGLKS